MNKYLLFTLVSDPSLTINIINFQIDRLELNLGDAFRYIGAVDWSHAIQHTAGGFIPIVSDGQQAFASTVTSTATIGPVN